MVLCWAFSALQSLVLAAVVMKQDHGCCLQQHFSEAQAHISHWEQNVCCQMMKNLHLIKYRQRRRSYQDTE